MMKKLCSLLRFKLWTLRTNHGTSNTKVTNDAIRINKQLKYASCNLQYIMQAAIYMQYALYISIYNARIGIQINVP